MENNLPYRGWILGHPALWAGAVGPLIPAPMVITSMLLALYSILTVQGLTCISVLRDVLGEG